MKLKIITLSLMLLCSMQSCQAQKKRNINTKKENTMYPTVNKDFENFDNYRYENREDKKSSVLREFLQNGTYVELDGLGNRKQYWETPPNSYFKVCKYYYKDGKIKQKGLGFNGNAFAKGIWYEFDEQGKLIREIDYDKYYKFTFEDILKLCERENIEVKKGPILQSTGFHTSILRDYSPLNDQSTWTIEWLKKPYIIETIKLDGTTGRVLSRTDGKYINN